MSQIPMLDPSAVWAIDPTVLEAAIADPKAFYAAPMARSERRPYFIHAGEAVIDISGVLIGSSDKFSWLMSATGYGWIANAVKAADTDDEVASIRLNFDSPGGVVCGGLPAAAEVIASARKPVTSFISGACCSAAMPLAFAAGPGRVIASPMASAIGCLGVMATIRKLESDSMRIVEHRFVSKYTPRKNAPVDTAEGAEDLQQRIDDHGETFLALVGRLRGIGEDPATVAKRYGEGRAVAPREALAMGLIDSIQIGHGVDRSTSSGITASEDTMTEKTQASADQLLATAKALDEMTGRATAAEADALKWKGAAEAAVTRAESAEQGKSLAEARAASLEQELANERNERIEAEAGIEFDRCHAAGDFSADEREGFVEAYKDRAAGDDRLWRFGFEKRIGAGRSGGIAGGAEAMTHGHKVEKVVEKATDDRIRAICAKSGRKPSEILDLVARHRAAHHVDEAAALAAVERRFAAVS